MTIEEHQNDKKKEARARQDIPEEAGLVDGSRRNFAKAGLAASGVILTLASRPVLGEWVCNTPSGFVSGNVSSHGAPTLCSGRSPGYWRAHPEQWPSPYTAGACTGRNGGGECKAWSGGTLFRDVFSCSGYSSSLAGPVNSPYSMMQVISLNGNGDSQQLGGHIVAALLNARIGLTSVLAEAQVISMFKECDAMGYFEPTAGVKWYPADIVAYLKTTMTL